MTRHIHAFSLLVPSYDAGLAFYVDTLGFALLQDIPIEDGKRWVLIAPEPDSATKIVLAEPDGAEQKAALGNQLGGRVGFFLHTEDFAANHTRMLAAGVHFEEEPRREPYGTVAVWRDPFGNRWDLLQLKA